MRYMATIYVSDVMDVVAATVEVQGWVEQWGPPETLWSTTVVLPGVGETDVPRWLARAFQALSQDMDNPAREGSRAGLPTGGPHTLSEAGDRDSDVMGLTVAGGAARTRKSPRSVRSQ